MTALDDDMAALRNRLVAALYDELQGELGIPRISAAVDVAIASSSVRVLVETVIAGFGVQEAYAAALPGPPPPAVAAAAEVFDTGRATSREIYNLSIP
jgi:hypothetical protein